MCSREMRKHLVASESVLERDGKASYGIRVCARERERRKPLVASEYVLEKDEKASCGIRGCARERCESNSRVLTPPPRRCMALAPRRRSSKPIFSFKVTLTLSLSTLSISEVGLLALLSLCFYYTYSALRCTPSSACPTQPNPKFFEVVVDCV